MTGNFQTYEFPNQRIPNSKKDKAWAAQCCDWIISQAQGLKDVEDLEKKYNILNGNIPEDFYKKILNPYNSTNEKYKRFPATMRNYDMIKGIVRRYVSEYIKNPHDFIVGANNPEVILARNSKLRQELLVIAEQQIATVIAQKYQEWINQGQDPKQFNPQEQVNVEEFIKNFNENYVDDISAQGQEILNIVKDLTEDTLFYARAYFDFVTFGECYTYTDVVGKKIVKKVISPIDAYPVNTDNIFREDDDMFACRRKLTYQQIIDEFDDYLDEQQREFLNTYYAKHGGTADSKKLMFNAYQNYFPEICGKFSKEDRELFKSKSIMQRDNNTDLYDVWHVVWRGDVRRAIVTYVNEAGLIDKRIENDDYKLNSSIGDIDIEYIYEPQVYESTRIGTRNDAVYPYDARAVSFNRNGKLPYNGLNELLPGFGKFSIVESVTPYQVFYNIVAYHREMIIAKNKMSILLIAKSLLGKNAEATIHKMLADGVLYIDDENDQGMLRAQQIRMLNASLGDYITQLSGLLKEIEEAAKNQVDMTPQRYGEIANSAGKGVTSEAIMRGSMGSVIIEFMMDCMRERDYARDMDYTKLAWIDGLDTSYKDEDGNLKYISLDVDKHIYADYVIKAKNSIKENEKLEQIKQFAFSAAQNGDSMMAMAAITGDNVESIKKLIQKFQKEKETHEMELKQMDQQLAQMQQEFELQKIQAKGEEDRKTKQLEGIIDSEIELIRADANMISYNAEVGDSAKQEGLERLENMRDQIEREKLQVQREKNLLDAMSKAEDRKVKEKDIEAKIQIAKTNKNKYDVKAKK